LNVTPALAICFGAAALAAVMPREFVERGVESARSELGGGFNFLSALPPVRLLRIYRLLLRNRFG